MKRAEFIKRIGTAFAALVAWVKVNEGISEPIRKIDTATVLWNKTYVCRDGVNWEEVELPVNIDKEYIV